MTRIQIINELKKSVKISEATFYRFVKSKFFNEKTIVPKGLYSKEFNVNFDKLIINFNKFKSQMNKNKRVKKPRKYKGCLEGKVDLNVSEHLEERKKRS